MPSAEVIDQIYRCPTTRYRGSKRKLLPWIANTLAKLEFETALDAFGGSGVVSYLFKAMGKSVTYNDLLKFNTIIAKAYISNHTTKLTENDINNLLDHTSNNHKFISETFDNIYYTQNENLELDNLLDGLTNTLNSNRSGRTKRTIAFAALCQTCLSKRPFNLFHRANLRLRTRSVHRTFGNKTTWERPISVLFRRYVHEYNNAIFDTGANCRVIQKDPLLITPKEYDLVYLDPPYLPSSSRAESVDYFSNYHFLEGMANYLSWHKLIDSSTKNLRLLANTTNDWINPSKIHELYDRFFDQYSKSIIVISYKAKGIPSIPTLIQKLKRHGRHVRTISMRYNYALNQQNGNAATNREVLIIAT